MHTGNGDEKARGELGNRLLSMLDADLEDRLQGIEARVRAIETVEVNSDECDRASNGEFAPLLLKPGEAAATLRVSPRKLWELTNTGEIPSVRIGRALRYPVEDLKDWIGRKRKRSA